MFDNSEFRQVFLEELEEQIMTMEEEILSLEKQGSHSEGIQRLFRAAHTIKGSSAAMGYMELKQLTHEWEHLLDMLRNEELEMTRELTNLFFQCLDFIKDLQNSIIHEELLPDPSAVIKELGRFSIANTESVAAAKESAGEALPEEAEQLLREYIHSGQTVYTITVKLTEDCMMKLARISIIDISLRAFGEVLWNEPNMKLVQDDQDIHAIRWLIATQEVEPDALEQAVAGLMDVQSVRVEAAMPSQPEAETAAVLELEQENVYMLPGFAGSVAQEEADKTQQSKASVKQQTIRVNVERLENVLDLLGELVIDQTRLKQAIQTLYQAYGYSETMDDLGEISDHLSRLIGSLQENVLKVRMLPIEQLFSRFPRMVRDLAQTLNKSVDLQMVGGDTELDRTLIEEVGDPLIHLIRNAVDHGIEMPKERVRCGKPEQGTVRISAAHEDNQVVVVVEDDGGGIDTNKLRKSAVAKGVITAEEAALLDEHKALRLIFHPGFSTASQLSDVSGRGVGMDIVRTDIERLGGIIDIDTTVGVGTKFTIRLPLTLAITTGLLVKASDQTFILPMSAVVEIIRVDTSTLKMIKGSPVIKIRNQIVPFVWLHEMFGYSRTEGSSDKIPVVMIGRAEQRLAIAVDQLLGNQEVVIKTLGSYVGKVDGISGATILGNGRIALILEIGGIMKKASGIS
ncbi:two-component system, chemotaxis family, sensor kinase CheA [Paenibacillus algorifonticola]|uniref:Chemotaxis protein CheA n=1 Tax=Paenibacillus algorifonticola TaxID=684063 RepID=A0A1I2E615_9BACL|nr:chemotaxis protein CheA [Paenibacillus algorifonticola]SFE88382.1 two-component system, chemotaxis family, sensor kinase CheA [Paenibacillus algorifonticola]